jgi:hypothetical protein
MPSHSPLTPEEQESLDELLEKLIASSEMHEIIAEVQQNSEFLTDETIQLISNYLTQSLPKFKTSISDSQLEKLISFGVVNQVVLEAADSNLNQKNISARLRSSHPSTKFAFGFFTLVMFVITGTILYLNRNPETLYLYFPKRFGLVEEIQCYEGALYDVSINRPQGWIRQDINNPMTYEAALLRPVQNQESKNQNVKVTISCEKLYGVISLNELANQLIDQIEANPNFKNTKFVHMVTRFWQIVLPLKLSIQHLIKMELSNSWKF